MEADIWQYYQAQNPGEVVVLGCDLWNGSQSQLATFGAITGTTYPLLQDCGTGAENFYSWYDNRDNFVVINKVGIIRYHALDLHSVSNGYHPDEIRACVDSLVGGGTVSVNEPLDPRRFLMTAAPNPFRSDVRIELSNPASTDLPARITVHDLSGRTIATLWDSPVPQGVTTVRWDGRSSRGERTAAGVYMVHAQVGQQRLSRRVVRVE